MHRALWAQLLLSDGGCCCCAALVLLMLRLLLLLPNSAKRAIYALDRDRRSIMRFASAHTSPVQWAHTHTQTCIRYNQVKTLACAFTIPADTTTTTTTTCHTRVECSRLHMQCAQVRSGYVQWKSITQYICVCICIPPYVTDMFFHHAKGSAARVRLCILQLYSRISRSDNHWHLRRCAHGAIQCGGVGCVACVRLRVL